MSIELKRMPVMHYYLAPSTWPSKANRWDQRWICTSCLFCLELFEIAQWLATLNWRFALICNRRSAIGRRSRFFSFFFFFTVDRTTNQVQTPSLPYESSFVCPRCANFWDDPLPSDPRKTWLGRFCKTKFWFRFRKGLRQISTGPGWSTPEEVEPNFLFCKPNFLFRFGSVNRKKCVVLANRCIVMSKNTTEKLNLCLLLDHYSWNQLAHRDPQQRGSLTKRPF